MVTCNPKPKKLQRWLSVMQRGEQIHSSMLHHEAKLEQALALKNRINRLSEDVADEVSIEFFAGQRMEVGDTFTLQHKGQTIEATVTGTPWVQLSVKRKNELLAFCYAKWSCDGQDFRNGLVGLVNGVWHGLEG